MWNICRQTVLSTNISSSKVGTIWAAPSYSVIKNDENENIDQGHKIILL